MRVLRGRAEDVDADREASADMLARTAETGEPAVRVWRPHRQVAFGRLDAGEPGYERARDAAREHGFPPVERDVGGRAVAHAGTTVACARTEPVGDYRAGIDERYERFLGALQAALRRLGVDAERGEPPDAFCPGARSLRRDGKLAGVAQRVQRDVAVVAGVVVVADHGRIAAVLADVYGALGVPFDPDSVGSIARAGGDAGPGRVVTVVEDELVGDAPREVRDVR